jgi:hypothetical protein
MSKKRSNSTKNPYPEGDKLQTFIQTRSRKGFVWRMVFQASTIIAIIALTVLIYNVIVGSFGFVALQNKVDPASLVLAVEEERLLTAPNTLSSEDDNELVKGIKDNPNAVGFFGYAYYQDNADKLRILSIDGVEPIAETAESGEYKMSRPLFIYTTAEIMQEKPHVAAFVNFYLTRVNDALEEVGYFPATEEASNEARQAWLAVNQPDRSEWPAVNPVEFGEEDGLVIAGSSTVYPLTREIAKQF